MPPPDQLRAHVEKLLSSQALGGSEQLKRLLEVVVERTANGDTVKEYTLGVEAFGRPADYDPKIDPIVRVQARRLRTKLDEYYSTEGVGDPIRVTMPKGGYVLVFESRAVAAPARSRQTLFLALGAVLIVSGVAGVAMRQTSKPEANLRSIAVLPLRNIADASGTALADEATEALITSLARNNSLRVASATTTRSFAATSDSLPDIAHALQVRWVVEGAVGQENGLVLLKLRLVDAASDRKVWADAFTTPQPQLSSTQQRTAATIATAIERFLAQPPNSTP
jgi:TolB-like protein